MKRTVLVVLVACLLVSAQPPPDAVRKEVERFQGTWRFVSIDFGPQKVPPDALKETKLVIKGDKFTVTVESSSYGGTFKVDPTKKPKTIDVTFTEGPAKGTMSLGIYELEGDTYKICVNEKGTRRPTEFVPNPERGDALEVLKREKP